MDLLSRFFIFSPYEREQEIHKCIHPKHFRVNIFLDDNWQNLKLYFGNDYAAIRLITILIIKIKRANKE